MRRTIELLARIKVLKHKLKEANNQLGILMKEDESIPGAPSSDLMKMLPKINELNSNIEDIREQYPHIDSKIPELKRAQAANILLDEVLKSKFRTKNIYK